MVGGVQELKWSQEVTVEEAGEPVKETYEIKVLEIGGDGYIHRLNLSRYCGFYIERYDIEFWGNQLTIHYKERPNIFSAFRERAVITYEDDFEEIPWWADPEELKETIDDLGVHKAYLLILDYIRTILSEPFEE